MGTRFAIQRGGNKTEAALPRRQALQFAGLLVGAGVLARAAPAWAQMEQPAEFLDRFIARAVPMLNDAPPAGSKRNALVQTLLREGFDLATIARFVAGPAIRGASPESRQAYQAAFEQNLIVTYGAQLADYDGATLTVGRVRSQDDRLAVVSSRLDRRDGAPVGIDWRLKRIGESWKIIDLIVEGVSMAQTQRSEFAAARQAAGGSLDNLTDLLRAQIARSANFKA